jgi:hypothetical protein
MLGVLVRLCPVQPEGWHDRSSAGRSGGSWLGNHGAIRRIPPRPSSLLFQADEVIR